MLSRDRKVTGELRHPCLQKTGMLLLHRQHPPTRKRAELASISSAKFTRRLSRGKVPLGRLYSRQVFHCFGPLSRQSSWPSHPHVFYRPIRFTATSSYRAVQSSALILRALRCPTSNWQANFTPGQGLVGGNCSGEGFAVRVAPSRSIGMSVAVWCVLPPTRH